MYTPETNKVDEIEDLDPGDVEILKKFGGLPEEQGEYDREEEENAKND